MGHLLGEGGFAQVFEVARSPLGGKKGKYAVKCLRSDLASSNKKMFEQAANTLAQEARIMSQLHHPNILALRGVSSDANQLPLPHSRSMDQFFLVTDRLKETLTDRLRKWKIHRPANAMQYKLQYALQIAKALQYLHEHRIIHRDVTASNIGFKEEHTVQLFDFGLSRKLPELTDSDCETVSSADDEQFETEELFHLTICGTQRFMAPETFGGKYNTKADVYSWAMTVVELMTEKKPYAYMTLPVHKILVLEQGARPRLDDDVFPAALCPILKGAWEECIADRWDMEQICDALEQYLAPPLKQSPLLKKQTHQEVSAARAALTFAHNLQTNKTTASAA